MKIIIVYTEHGISATILSAPLTFSVRRFTVVALSDTLCYFLDRKS